MMAIHIAAFTNSFMWTLMTTEGQYGTFEFHFTPKVTINFADFTPNPPNTLVPGNIVFEFTTMDNYGVTLYTN